MYYDEDLVLDLRLNYLDKYVDKFIIVESEFTHSGQKRKLRFDKKIFSKFKNKIDYIVLENQPKNLSKIDEDDSDNLKNSKYIMNAVKRENFQRNKLSEGLKSATNSDLIIISDVDEIPNLEHIDSHLNNKIILFKQTFFYYKFNLKLLDYEWFGSRACRKKDLRSPQWLRNIKNKVYPKWRIDTVFSKKKYSDIGIVKNGGWHFSNIKTPADIEKKMKNYLHHREYELNPIGENQIKDIIEKRKAIYNLKSDMRKNKFDSENDLIFTEMKELPLYLQNNIEKFKEWLI